MPDLRWRHDWRPEFHSKADPAGWHRVFARNCRDIDHKTDLAKKQQRQCPGLRHRKASFGQFQIFEL
jgi:hypothetical protein